MAGQGRRNHPSRSVLGAVRLASCGPLLLVCSTQLAGHSRSTLSKAEISLREPFPLGNRNKNTCSLSQQFPHRSAITSRCRKTRTDR